MAAFSFSRFYDDQVHGLRYQTLQISPALLMTNTETVAVYVFFVPQRINVLRVIPRFSGVHSGYGLHSTYSFIDTSELIYLKTLRLSSGLVITQINANAA